MAKIGTVSYNIYCNFTNYGSALQTWALHQVVSKLGHTPVLVDYCPDILADKDPLHPFPAMWDKDSESKRMAELTMPAICENFQKFERFYSERFTRTAEKYTSRNFNRITDSENIRSFICGSDTIFCPDEFGFDDGYYAEYDCMRGRSVSYAASFGDPHFTPGMYETLNSRLQNFLALGIREKQMIPHVKAHTRVPVQQTLDPTLLLDADEYAPITARGNEEGGYLLMYSRRYMPEMEDFAEHTAESNGLGIVDISLRAVNAEKGHKMSYSAGVEEFLSLAKNAEYIVTNSYHGVIFAIQFRKPFATFIREQTSSKITDLLSLLSLQVRIITQGGGGVNYVVNYDPVHRKIRELREKSISFLKTELDILEGKSNVS